MHRADSLTTFMCQLSSGGLHLLEPSGPVQASNGIFLPLLRADKKINWLLSCVAVLTELITDKLMGKNSTQ